MAARTDDISDTPPAPETGQGSDITPEKKFVSTGYHVHNEVTYRGVDWLLNSTLGVASTYGVARTEKGEKYFQKPVTNFFKKILSPVLKNEASLAEGAKWGTSFASIMVGGFTIIPLMIALEHKKTKRKIIRWLDEKMYGKEAVANDPKFEESYCRIDDEPTKKFAAGMAARFIAIAPLIAVASIPATNKRLIKYIYDPIGNVTKWAAEKVGIRPGEKMLDPAFGRLEHLDGDPASPKQMQSNWDFLHRTIGFDFGLTVVYAKLHEITYKFLAKHSAQPDRNGQGRAAAQPESTGMSSVPDDATGQSANAARPEGAARRQRPRKAENFVSALDASRLQDGQLAI